MRDKKVKSKILKPGSSNRIGSNDSCARYRIRFEKTFDESGGHHTGTKKAYFQLMIHRAIDWKGEEGRDERMRSLCCEIA
jgi:hypothetical protein